MPTISAGGDNVAQIDEDITLPILCKLGECVAEAGQPEKVQGFLYCVRVVFALLDILVHDGNVLLVALKGAIDLGDSEDRRRQLPRKASEHVGLDGQPAVALSQTWNCRYRAEIYRWAWTFT